MWFRCLRILLSEFVGVPCSIHEMEALRSELTAKVVSVAADHANAMEAMEKQLLEAKAAHQAEIKERLTMEVELGRVTAAASIQGAYRAARSRSGLRQLSTGLMARTEQMELRLSAQSERVLVETKDGIQAMNEAHRAEIAALQTELEEAQASHAGTSEEVLPVARSAIAPGPYKDVIRASQGLIMTL